MQSKFSLIFWPLLIGIGIGIGIITVVRLVVVQKSSFLSPLGINSESLTPHIPSQKPLIGFLPYWTMPETDIPYHLLDYLAYFGIALNDDGSIKTMENQYVEPGWYHLQGNTLNTILATAKKRGVKTIITITAFNNQTIDHLLQNESAKKRAITSISTIMKDYQFDGVNLDFEYNSADADTNTSTFYAQFINDLRKVLITLNPKVEISLDLYANGFIKDHPYQVVELDKAADFLILMGYDFHQASSSNAGPVAPLKSKSNRSISEALQAAINKGINPAKIILAMPFYGYEWQTTSKDYAASTFPGTGAMASYKRVSKLITSDNLTPQWDTQAMSPWIVYTKDDEIRQIYYENDESIGLKLQLIDQINLGGGAIWALGYEGQDAPVWKVIETWRKKQ